jgi:hypothetical protein
LHRSLPAYLGVVLGAEVTLLALFDISIHHDWRLK